MSYRFGMPWGVSKCWQKSFLVNCPFKCFPVDCKLDCWMELPYERRSVPLAMKAKKAIAQINIGAALPQNWMRTNNLKFSSKTNKTPLNTNNLMHNGYGFPNIHFEQKISQAIVLTVICCLSFMRCCCFWAIWHLVATFVHCNFTTKCLPALIFEHFMRWPVECLPHLNG